MPALPRRLLAEFVGTALLLATVIGSGIAAQRLSPGNTGLELLENAITIGAVLAAIIVTLSPVSGAHLNPVVSLVDWGLGGLKGRHVLAYVPTQIAGAVAGTVVGNLMFSLAPVTISTKVRWGAGHWLSEVVATFGLMLVVFGLVRSRRAPAIPAAVGAYITGAIFFTSSASFANPAVTIARMLSDTFAGISPGSVLPFVLAELGGGLLGWLAIRLLYPAAPRPVVAASGAGLEIGAEDSAVRVREAHPEETPEVSRLVREAGLPLDGLEGATLVLVAESQGELVGTIALEEHGSGEGLAYLLRSAAVTPTWRRRGVGRALTWAALAHVDSAGAPAALLTETADGYFTAFGFEPVARDQLPAALMASPQLSGACPISAHALLRRPGAA